MKYYFWPIKSSKFEFKRIYNILSIYLIKRRLNLFISRTSKLSQTTQPRTSSSPHYTRKNDPNSVLDNLSYYQWIPWGCGVSYCQWIPWAVGRKFDRFIKSPTVIHKSHQVLIRDAIKHDTDLKPFKF